MENVPIERLQSFYRKYYQPDNAMLVIAGNFDEPAALIAVIDAIHEAARHRQTLEEANALAGPLFGPTWQILRSDWPAMRCMRARRMAVSVCGARSNEARKASAARA